MGSIVFQEIRKGSRDATVVTLEHVIPLDREDVSSGLILMFF